MFFHAYNYANRASYYDGKQTKLYIFKFEIDEQLILPDMDELRLHPELLISECNSINVDESIEAFGSVCIGQDIILSTSLVSYMSPNAYDLETVNVDDWDMNQIINIRKYEKLKNSKMLIAAMNSFTAVYPWCKI